jgi:hypothetical protein
MAGQRFLLLWRGGRDGFGARDFHDRRNGHANTLTVIFDTNGNIFGRFTSVKWKSRVWNGRTENENNGWKVDPTLKRFLFTLQNPHNIPTQRFALKVIIRNYAIDSTSRWGRALTGICVHDHCNANANSWTDIGNCHTNNTELDGKTVFTGSLLFQVKKIEVFEIAGEISLPIVVLSGLRNLLFEPSRALRQSLELNSSQRAEIYSMFSFMTFE